MSFIIFFLLLSLILPSYGEETKARNAKNLEEFLLYGNFSGRLRSYYMNRTFKGSNPQQSTAIGLWLNYQSKQWNNLSFTLTGYTSQPMLNNNPDYGGASLLLNNQGGFSVLGRAYLDASLGKNTLRLYRQTMDTPFLNTYDFRMVPVALEAYTLRGELSKKLDYIFSYVTKIKGWNNTGFQYMSDYAGYAGTQKTVAFGGINYYPSDTWKLQIWDYQCQDYMNIIYFQSDANWNASSDVQLSLSTQGLKQHSIGSAIGGNFSTGMWGAQGGITWKGLNFNLAYNSTSTGYNIVNPWGSYQGYSSLIEEDCDLAGENAWTTGFAYDFSKIGIKGLSMFTNHSRSYLVNSGDNSSPRQNEYDITFDYKLSESLAIRLREAIVTSAFDMNNLNYSDTRMILNYTF